MDFTNTINEIRRKVDIVDVISSYLPLTEKGKNHFGICPFHDDTNPSMSVSRDKQIFKCFSCGASGNVFDFVMNYEHVSFREALGILSEKTGIEIKGINIGKKTNKYDKFYEIYDLALKYYQNNMSSSYAKEAKTYLNGRNIDEAMIKDYKIGLSLDKVDNLTEQQDVVRESVEATIVVPSVTMEGDYFITPARGKYHIKVKLINNSEHDCSALYLPKNIVIIAHNKKLTYLEPKNGKVDFKTANETDYNPLKCDDKDVLQVLSAGFDKFVDQS